MSPETPHKIDLIDPPAHLLRDVILRAQDERLLANVRRRFILFCFLLAVSFFLIIPASLAFLEAMHHAGFVELLSLALSDRDLVLREWQNFGSSLLEALPITTLLVLLGLTFSFFLSLQFILREYKRALWKHHLQTSS